MTRRFSALLLIVLALLQPSLARAQWAHQPSGTGVAAPAPVLSQDEGIAAVVNDNIVSTADVRARLALAMLTSNLPNTAEVRQHLLPQVLHSLIDEQLQIQEGKRLDISVNEEEIQTAMNRLAQDNKIPGGDMAAFLTSRGVPPSTMTAQARAALTWNKVVARTLRPRVDIGDDEIDAVVERMRANAGKQEYLVSEIYLAVDTPADDDRVRKFAENLVQQIRGGASFGAVARQFSQGSGSSNGGDIGWIQVGQLAPELDKTLQSLNAGEIAEPVHAANGYHILGVREKRTLALGDIKDMSVNLQQAFRAFTPEQSRELLLKEADQLRQSFSDCTGLSAKLGRDFPAWRWQDLGEVKLVDAPSWLVEKVRDVGVGRSSEAMATDKGALILFVCGRTMPETIDRTEILNTIGTERMELLARRLLRDLRRDAYLDVRLTMSP